MVLEKTLESPLDCKEIKPVHPKGNQSQCSLEELKLKLELQHFGHLMRRTDSLEKTPMLGKIEDRRRGRTTQDQMVEYHWLNGHEFEQAPGTGDGQGSLTCCSPWGCKESDMTERLNWILWQSTGKTSENNRLCLKTRAAGGGGRGLHHLFLLPSAPIHWPTGCLPAVWLCLNLGHSLNLK